MKFLAAILLLATWCICDAAGTVYFDGEVAETTVLPLKLECKHPFTYIHLGSVTYNGTIMTEQQTKQAADDCGSQTEAQKGKGGALITCFLTFGDKFSTDNRAVLRAVFKCMNGKPASAPGGKEWEKQKGKDRALLTAHPNGLNFVKFNCPGVKEFVNVVQLLQEGEVVTTSLEKYKQLVKVECYKQSAKLVGKGSEVPLSCSVEFDAKDAADLEVKYRCEDPPMSFATADGYSIII